MAKVDVEADFPSLKNRDYDLSDEDFNYNCLAFALGDQNQWWEPPRGLGAYWPEGFPEDTISTDRGIDHPSSEGSLSISNRPPFQMPPQLQFMPKETSGPTSQGSRMACGQASWATGMTSRGLPWKT
jgi:hypothetical protein